MGHTKCAESCTRWIRLARDGNGTDINAVHGDKEGTI